VKTDLAESMEVVIGTGSMPPKKWADAFVDGYCAIGLHDDRLAFFIFWYLKRQHNVRITDLVVWMRHESARHPETYPHTHRVFGRLLDCARGVQENGYSQLIEPEGYGGIPYDPPDGAFLELLWCKEDFYAEFYDLAKAFLYNRGIDYDESVLEDLFAFQNAVIAHPNNHEEATGVAFRYDWISYFSPSFNLGPATELKRCEAAYTVRDEAPCKGDAKRYLETHFKIRGIPPFNELHDGNANRVFPPVSLQMTE
jgi:hypothetical protein